MTTKTYEFITVERDGKVAVITLNRPDVLNAINFEMDNELHDALWAAEADEDVRVIVITGAGKAFSSGFDLSSGGAAFGAEAHEEHNKTLGETDESITDRYALWTMRTPIIAALNGHAIGAALTLSLLMDIRFAAEDAKLRFPFTRLNMIPEANSTWLLPRLVGVSRAMELLLSGRFFSGAEAAEIGLVSAAYPREQLMDKVMEFAHDMATNTAPAALGITKQLIYQMLEETDRRAGMTRETKLTWWTGEQPDTMAGVMAVMTKQEPQWQQSKHTELPEDLR